MLIYGLQSVLPLLQEEHYQFKLLANEKGVVLFPIEIEHRDAGQHGIRYADNYEGNALAAMVKPGGVAF